MSTQTSNGGGRRPPPSPERQRVDKDVGGRPVRSDFYGGFVSRLLFRQGGKEHELYNQQTDGPFPFVLPEPEMKPKAKSLFEFWGPGGGRVAFEIDDPGGTIEQIEIKLKKAGAATSDQAVVGMQDDDGGTIIIVESSTICPPACP
ncbi:MAG TPA: hypothetical protein VF746_31085 [Longimicrobium sp.]|jgi:hypothetical protein